MSDHGEKPAAGRGGNEPKLEPVDGIDRPRAWLTGAGLGFLVLAAMVIAFVIGTNYSDESERAASAEQEVPVLPQDLSGPGKDLFVARCGACHTLSEAGTTGTTGPDLGKLAPAQAVVEEAIVSGGTGSGMMPPGLVSGEEVQQVAEYVAAASGGS